MSDTRAARGRGSERVGAASDARVASRGRLPWVRTVGVRVDGDGGTR
jgi:hypothetical protein